LEVTRHTRWKKDEALGLEGEKKEECNNYVNGLFGLGYELNIAKDILMWSWDTKGG